MDSKSDISNDPKLAKDAGKYGKASLRDDNTNDPNFFNGMQKNITRRTVC